MIAAVTTVWRLRDYSRDTRFCLGAQRESKMSVECFHRSSRVIHEILMPDVENWFGERLGVCRLLHHEGGSMPMFVLIPYDGGSFNTPRKRLPEDFGQLGYREQNMRRITVNEYNSCIGIDRS
jgi:hypothetical protein